MRVLILAGCETTSVSLTWARIELCQDPSTQAKLHAELLAAAPASDIPYDALTSPDALPYHDAVTREILRVAPAPGRARAVGGRGQCVAALEARDVAQWRASG